jgi:hypothetical protein
LSRECAANHARPATQAPAITPISNASTNGIDLRNNFCIETFRRFGIGLFAIMLERNRIIEKAGSPFPTPCSKSDSARI